MKDKRSFLNFGILIIAAVAATIFILGEAEKAVAEINALSDMPVYIGLRQMEYKENREVMGVSN